MGRKSGIIVRGQRECPRRPIVTATSQTGIITTADKTVHMGSTTPVGGWVRATVTEPF